MRKFNEKIQEKRGKEQTHVYAAGLDENLKIYVKAKLTLISPHIAEDGEWELYKPPKFLRLCRGDRYKKDKEYERFVNRVSELNERCPCKDGYVLMCYGIQPEEVLQTKMQEIKKRRDKLEKWSLFDWLAEDSFVILWLPKEDS